MPETISDTGPVLHLQEISRLATLSVVAPLTLQSGNIGRGDLERATDDLFNRSTLHLSRAFRAYLRQLLADLS